MSSQPHTVLPWVVRRTRLPLLSLRCVACRSESATTGEGRFRVNANRKLLTVWLLVRCVSCDRTSKLTVHERAPVRTFDPAELDGYHANDPELVAFTLLDPMFARRNRFTLDWKGAWQMDSATAWRAEALPVKVGVIFRDPVPVRPERLIAQGLGFSRNEVLRRIKCDIPLRRPTSAGFTFTVVARSEPGAHALTASAQHPPSPSTNPPTSSCAPFPAGCGGDADGSGPGASIACAQAARRVVLCTRG